MSRCSAHCDRKQSPSSFLAVWATGPSRSTRNRNGWAFEPVGALVAATKIFARSSAGIGSGRNLRIARVVAIPSNRPISPDGGVGSEVKTHQLSQRTRQRIKTNVEASISFLAAKSQRSRSAVAAFGSPSQASVALRSALSARIMPAATVMFEDSSTRMKLPVKRFCPYSSKNSGEVV